ncbi:hypothetical protein FKM82_024726, partial [Ascaphus truei]
HRPGSLPSCFVIPASLVFGKKRKRGVFTGFVVCLIGREQEPGIWGGCQHRIGPEICFLPLVDFDFCFVLSTHNAAWRVRNNLEASCGERRPAPHRRKRRLTLLLEERRKGKVFPT